MSVFLEHAVIEVDCWHSLNTCQLNFKTKFWLIEITVLNISSHSLQCIRNISLTPEREKNILFLTHFPLFSPHFTKYAFFKYILNFLKYFRKQTISYLKSFVLPCIRAINFSKTNFNKKHSTVSPTIIHKFHGIRTVITRDGKPHNQAC